MAQLIDGNKVTQISSTMDKFVDGFAYGQAYAAGAASLAALSGDVFANYPGKWDVVRSNNMVATLSNGSLSINMGTTSGAELLLLGRSTTTIPANIIVSLNMSQRIAANEVRIGYVQIDPATGNPVANPQMANFFMNSASVLWNGTTSTTVVTETMEGGQPAMTSVSMTLPSSSTAMQDYSIECRPEDVSYSVQTANSSGTRTGGATRISTVVPSPQRLYRPFLWLRNNGAPASATTVTVARVVSMDIQEVQIEVGGGRGNLAGSQAIPVGFVSGANSVGVTNMTASSSANGTSTHKLISAATVNATSVKATPGRLLAGSVANLATSTRFLKLFNKASAPVVGTDVPVMTIPLLAGQTNMLTVCTAAVGVYFSAGIAYAITGGVADNDTTVIAAADVVVNLVIA